MTRLFEDFLVSNSEDWKERLKKDLKGISFEDLCTIDRNGINIAPFYTEQVPNAGPVCNQNDWVICSQIEVSDNAKSANLQALEELQNGASGIIFVCSADVDLNQLLQDISIAHIQLRFLLKGDVQVFVAAWKQYLNKLPLEASALDCWIIQDSITALLQGQNIALEQAKANQKAIVKASGRLAVDATLYQNAGANTLSQLAYTTAQLNEYLYWADQDGYLGEIKQISFALCNGTDFFEEIAKLRAIRLMIQQVLATYAINPSLSLHVETSDTYRAPFDAYSNLLRDTIAAMSAVLGACQSLYIHPFDKGLKASNDFSRRLSRNQQLILKEEAYLHRVADVSSGSFYLEQLSNELAQKAWEMFQSVEQESGIISCIQNGSLKATIEEQATKWIQEYRDGKRVLIGVNKYINAQDQPQKIENVGSQNNDKLGIAKISLTQEILNS